MSELKFDFSIAPTEVGFGSDQYDFIRERIQFAVERDFGKLSSEEIRQLPSFSKILPKDITFSYPDVIHENQTLIFMIAGLITHPDGHYRTTDGKYVPLFFLYSNPNVRWKQLVECKNGEEVELRNLHNLESFRIQSVFPVDEFIVRIRDQYPHNIVYDKSFSSSSHCWQTFAEAVLKIPARWKVSIKCNTDCSVIVSGIFIPPLEKCHDHENDMFNPEDHGFRVQY